MIVVGRARTQADGRRTLTVCQGGSVPEQFPPIEPYETGLLDVGDGQRRPSVSSHGSSPSDGAASVTMGAVATKADPARDWLYISQRLTTDILKNATAATRNWDVQLSALFRNFGASLSRRQPAWNNDIEVALRATKAVKSITSETLDPETRAPYAHFALPLRYGVVKVNNPGFDLGLFTADTETEWGRTLISLAGSPSNFRTRRRRDDTPEAEWIPSDVDGYMELARAMIEDRDKQRFDLWHWRDEDPTIEVISDIAYTLQRESHKGLMMRDLEVLAKVHFLEGPVQLMPQLVYDVVVIGATVWATTPSTVPVA